jgi:7-keto-8-aminopelargonate synthetase-like enzyme
LNYIEVMELPEPIQQLGGNRVRWRGRELTYFSGCDYFRLSQRAQVQRAVEQGLRYFGLNVAASRVTTGQHWLYVRLEQAVAGFFKAPAALLLPGGYFGAGVAAQALAGEITHALIDERAHAALRDAALQLGCRIWTFKHRDVADVRRLVRRAGRGARLVLLTDGMFSHDGSAAPLRAYLVALPSTARVLVDDAHGAGVLGVNGRGSLEHERVGRSRVIQCITLSKAFGVYGGAVLGSKSFRAQMLARSRAFVGSTPLPLPLANAAVQAVALLQRNHRQRARLHHNAAQLRAALRANGWSVADMPGPIVALHPRSASVARRWRRQLLAAGIYPPFTRYGSAHGYFRFVVSSEHTREDLSALASALGRGG